MHTIATLTEADFTIQIAREDTDLLIAFCPDDDGKTCAYEYAAPMTFSWHSNDQDEPLRPDQYPAYHQRLESVFFAFLRQGALL